jgi:hypothetical protein
VATVELIEAKKISFSVSDAEKKNGGSGAGGGSPPNPTGVPRRCTIQDEMHESLGQRDDGARQQHTHTQPKHDGHIRESV